MSNEPGHAQASYLYVILDGKEYGPLSKQQVCDMARHGQLLGETLAWKEGLADWKRLDQLVTMPSTEPEGASMVPVKISEKSASVSREGQSGSVGWLRKAVRFIFGRGMTKDEVEMVKWYRNAAEQGDVKAQVFLALCYAHGRFVAKDAVESVRWYRKAADQGDPSGQFNLGVSYNFGTGATKDVVEAVKWYRKAAEQNHAGAQNNLGTCYAIGEGVTKDVVEAVKWFRKAAERGNTDAQYNLGNSYAQGVGVTLDWVEAYKWWLLAGAQGNVCAKQEFAILETMITDTEQAEGKRRAREWKPHK